MHSIRAVSIRTHRPLCTAARFCESIIAPTHLFVVVLHIKSFGRNTERGSRPHCTAVQQKVSGKSVPQQKLTGWMYARCSQSSAYRVFSASSPVQASVFGGCDVKSHKSHAPAANWSNAVEFSELTHRTTASKVSSACAAYTLSPQIHFLGQYSSKNLNVMHCPLKLLHAPEPKRLVTLLSPISTFTCDACIEPSGSGGTFSAHAWRLCISSASAVLLEAACARYRQQHMGQASRTRAATSVSRRACVHSVTALKHDIGPSRLHRHRTFHGSLKNGLLHSDRFHSLHFCLRLLVRRRLLRNLQSGFAQPESAWIVSLQDEGFCAL
jgi:hypothetical protein